MLNSIQRAAIDYITTYSAKRKNNAIEVIEHVRAMSNISKSNLDQALQKIKDHARVALHFHPDRIAAENKTVIESLLEEGIYKNQFESMISNGLLSPFPGGAREVWENNLFKGTYSNTNLADRPKYGSLNLMLHADGPSPRFGSCYLLLKKKVSQRCTFTFMDSHKNPQARGTMEIFEDIFANLLLESFERDFALGEKNIRPPRLISHLVNNLPQLFNAQHFPLGRNLDHYIEAQVHGIINLESDAEILVADPSFEHKETGELIRKVSEKYNLQLQWHHGFVIDVDSVPTDFRGETMPSLARRIAISDFLDASCIGEAAVNLKLHPERWSDRGTYEQCAQELKLLWHVLVRYGKPMLD